MDYCTVEDKFFETCCNCCDHNHPDINVVEIDRGTAKQKLIDTKSIMNILEKKSVNQLLGDYKPVHTCIEKTKSFLEDFIESL